MTELVTATVIEIVTEGPQGPKGDQGDPGSGFLPPVVNPPEGLIPDGSIVHADGPKSYTFPLGSESTIGMKIKALTGIITIVATAPDTIEETILTAPQAYEYSPNSGGWVVI